jgi:ubiquinone/menaquinone biosynthesis C-methylase UbiE
MDINYAKYLLKKTKEDYNLIAQDFSRTRQIVWGELAIFKKYLSDGDKLLDVGCGNGRLSEFSKNKKINYIGADVSSELISLAKKRYPKKRFLVADNLNLPFLDDNFDKVFSIAVLHTIPSANFRKKAIFEIKRVLKEKGLFFATVWDMKWKNKLPLFLKYSFLKMIGKSRLDFGDVFVPWADKTKRYYHLFTEKELVSLVREAGFKIIEKGIIRNSTKKRSNIYLIAEKQK